MHISVTVANGKATSMCLTAESLEDRDTLIALFAGLPAPPFEMHLFDERGTKARPATLQMHWLGDFAAPKGEVEK